MRDNQNWCRFYKIMTSHKRNCIQNHRQLDCLYNKCGLTTKQNSKSPHYLLFVREPYLIRASNMEKLVKIHNEWSITNISIWYTLRYFRLGCSGASSLWLAVLIDHQWPIYGGSWAGVWAKPQLNVGGGLAGIGLASLLMEWANASFGIGVLDP